MRQIYHPAQTTVQDRVYELAGFTKEALETLILFLLVAALWGAILYQGLLSLQ
ncbi:MAG: hypothetical protein ACRDFX_10370 [Chloroflexota bacterium]